MARSIGSRLELIGEADPAAVAGEEQQAAPVPQRASRLEPAVLSLLITSLKVVSQRTVIALAGLVDLALLGSAFALWLLIIKDPTPPQLISVGGYAIFVLTALWFRRK